MTNKKHNPTAQARFFDASKVAAVVAAHPQAQVRDLGQVCIEMHSCCCMCEPWGAPCRTAQAWLVTGLHNRQIARALHAAGFVPRDQHLV